MSGRTVRKKNETFELRGVNHLALVCRASAFNLSHQHL